MVEVDIDPNDWEERRRLSFALAIIEDRPQFSMMICRISMRAAQKLWTIMASPFGRTIGLSLLMLALLAAADGRGTQAASGSTFARYASPETAETIGAPSSHPAKVASVSRCKMFLTIGTSREGMILGLCAMTS